MRTLRWLGEHGMIACEFGLFLILDKPELSFEFDGLFFEEAVMKKVLKGSDHPLSEDEVLELSEWLDEQLPLFVNGVDQDGNYVEGVPWCAVVKTVTIPPPAPTGWRYDFAASEAGDDHWVKLH